MTVIVMLVHVGVGTVWLGSMVYSQGVVQPRVGRLFGEPARAEEVYRELAAGNRRLHIVAPPGSGKTVLGLYLWSECIRRRAVVLSPNSAIQAQWAARIDLFAVISNSELMLLEDRSATAEEPSASAP